MIKKYITKLPEGRETQYATLLGRQVLLTDGKIVNESLLTRIYSSYFKEIKDTETPVKQEPVIEEVKEEKVVEVTYQKSKKSQKRKKKLRLQSQEVVERRMLKEI